MYRQCIPKLQFVSGYFWGLGRGVRYRSDKTSPFARVSLVPDPARHFCVPVRGPPGLYHLRLCQLLCSLSPLSDCFSLVTSTDPCALQQLCYHPRMGCCLKLCRDFRSTCALSQWLCLCSDQLFSIRSISKTLPRGLHTCLLSPALHESLKSKGEPLKVAIFKQGPTCACVLREQSVGMSSGAPGWVGSAADMALTGTRGFLMNSRLGAQTHSIACAQLHTTFSFLRWLELSTDGH